MDSFDGSETYCIYRFNAPAGYRVFLRILAIDMFPRMDQQRLCQPRLNVRDMDDDGSRLFLRSYCSQSELHVAETIISLSSRIQVVYRGPSSRSGKLEVRYEFVPDDNYETEQTRDLKSLPSPSFSEPCETIPCFRLCQDGELLKDERDCTICECRAEQDYKFWMPRCRIVENDILENIQRSENHLRPPTCDQDGHFASVQCIDEKCFRVDRYTGDVIDEISAIDPRY
ncbi:uncharacterized protein [Antedon mediterranea]|uniref:uncharacterized protein n=1 Tax=Antedon mediterranea TaxID=105859 RepID=UPI003AF825CE